MEGLSNVNNAIAKIWRENVWLRYGVAVVCSVIAVVPIVLSILNPTYCNDSFVLLEETERISEGWVPYTEMHLNYPPLWFYLMAGLELLFGWKDAMYYPYQMIVHYVFVIGCAWFVFCIARRIGVGRFSSLMGACLFLVMSHWMIGNAVLLPIPSMFFGLASCSLLFWLRDSEAIRIDKFCLLYVFAGVLASCAFMVKQFGLGFVALGVLLIVMYRKDKMWLKLFMFLFGAFIPFVICYAVWGDLFFQSTLHNGYGTNGVAMKDAFGVEVLFNSLLVVLDGFFYFLLRNAPFVFLFLGLLQELRKRSWRKVVLFCLLATMGFLTMLIVIPASVHGLADKNHLYVVPFAAIMFSMMLSLVKEAKTGMKYVMALFLSFSVAWSLWGTYHNRVMKSYLHDFRYENCLSMPWGRLTEVIPMGSTVILPETPEYYFLPDSLCYLPPLIREAGYSYGGMETTIEKTKKRYENAEYMVFTSNDYMFWKGSCPSGEPVAEDDLYQFEYRMMRNEVGFRTDTVRYSNGYWVVIHLRERFNNGD